MLATFVNSSDGFQDCWVPFFSLFNLYGGSLRETPIYLNTERAKVDWQGLSLKATAVWPRDEVTRPTWSMCLLRGLQQVGEPYVLYLQEDYFLKQHVNDRRIADALEVLCRDPKAGVVYLSYGPMFNRSDEHSDGVVRIRPPARYLVSTQAAIWRKDFLLSLICDWENGWMFEKFGSVRARQSQYKFLSIRPDIIVESPAIEYVMTGIIKGGWKEECKDLFLQHHVATDFSVRGFYQERGRLKSKLEVARKLFGSPNAALRSLASIVRL